VRRLLKIAAALAAAGLAFIAALRLFPIARARRAKPPDLAAAARTALQDAFGPDAAAIAIRSDDGIVTLRGEVDEMADIAAYEQAVRSLPGVVGVDNLIRLRLFGVAQRTTAPA